MASPITWHSLSRNELPDPARLLAMAQTGMNTGMEGFQKMSDGYLQGQQNLKDKAKVTATDNFLLDLQGVTTPEELAQRKGAFIASIRGQGEGIDGRVASSALDGRMSTLQQRAKAEWEFQNAQTDQKEAPIRDEALAAIARRDFLTANIIKSGNPGLRNMAALEQAQATAVRNQTVEGNQDTKFAWEGADQKQKEVMRPYEVKKVESDLATAEVNRTTLRAQAAAAGNSSALALANLEDRRTAQDALKLQASAQARLKGTMYEGGTYTPSDSIELGDLLAKNKGLDAGEQSRVLDRINKLASEGIAVPFTNADGVVDSRNVPIPKSLIKGIVAGARDDEYITAPWNWSESGANFVEKRLRAALKATETYKNGEGKDVVRSPAIDGYELLLSGQANAINNPAVPVGKGSTSSPKPPGEYKSPKPRKPSKE